MAYDLKITDAAKILASGVDLLGRVARGRRGARTDRLFVDPLDPLLELRDALAQ